MAAGTTNTYRIKAVNGAGTSERSHWFHIDIPAAPVPDKPTGLSATASHDVITLTWDDPGGDTITGYVILRRLRYDDPSGHFDELVADTGTATTTYTDDTVSAETSLHLPDQGHQRARRGERAFPLVPHPHPVSAGPGGLAVELTRSKSGGGIHLEFDRPLAEVEKAVISVRLSKVPGMERRDHQEDRICMRLSGAASANQNIQ